MNLLQLIVLAIGTVPGCWGTSVLLGPEGWGRGLLGVVLNALGAP